MDQQSELEVKRKEVRENILAMKDQIPTARLFNFLGQAFSKQSAGYWLSNLIIMILVEFSPWLLIGLILGELVPNRYLWFPGTIALIEGIVCFFVAHILTLNVLDDISNKIIPKISNSDDLIKIMEWFEVSWHKRTILTVILVWTLAWLSLGPAAFSIIYQRFVGFGFLLTCIVCAVLVGIAFYTVFWITWLDLSLRRYQYELNTVSPADSEIVSTIMNMSTKCIYVLAAFFACITVINASNLLDAPIRVVFSIPFLMISWISIFIQFFSTRSTIAMIINDAKWKTLNRIQTKINALEATGDLSDKETAEKLLRLADIHKQIRTSHSNAFDIKSLSTLFSQLMLPLLGLLLGNLDKLQNLFH